MKMYNQTNIKNNIIYFPLWRIKPIEYTPWTWESRYLSVVSIDAVNRWPHNCRRLGAITLAEKVDFCQYCGARKENEPTIDAIMDYMEIEYE